MLFQFVLDQLAVVVENLIANRTHPVVTLVTGQVLKANRAESLITQSFIVLMESLFIRSHLSLGTSGRPKMQT